MTAAANKAALNHSATANNTAQDVVILGGGLTGMSISLRLERSGIPHTLVGGPPGHAPRLGESLNLEGTLHLDEFAGEYHDFFGPKTGATAYLGDHAVYCGFHVAGKPINRIFYKLLGTHAPAEFHHIDRIALDNAMWERTESSRHARIVDAKVESIGYDKTTDLVTAIDLSTGDTLRPKVVFDATNHKRVVAQAAGVPVQTMDEPQRVVYTHYHPDRPIPEPRPAYDRATNLIRLFREIDGIDAVAWYIPIRTYLSIGVSMVEGSNELNDEAVLTCVEDAYAARGIRYRQRYPEPSQVMSLNHRYYAHERAAGNNYMLAGQTFAATWWMGGAGVGTSFAAARMAEDFVRDPVKTGRTYTAYLKDLLPIHGTFAWMANTPLADVSRDSMAQFSDNFIRTNVSRLASAAQKGKTRTQRVSGRILEVAVKRKLVLNNYCEVVTAPLADQTEQIFGPEPGTAQADINQATVMRLADVISGRLPLDTVDELLDAAVVNHLDGITVTGTRTWKTWLTFLRDHPRTPGLELVDATTKLEADGRITLTARWRSGGRMSEPVDAAYRVKDGRIVEIWTKSGNYAFTLGRVMNTRLGPYAASVQAGVHKVRSRRQRV
jgi:flavin-dependent dehydrogenase